MALIKCPKCGREISDKSKKCIGCGWDVNLSLLDEKKDTSRIENEHKQMLKEAKLEIEKMKENAKLEIESMNESAKDMVMQKQKELELEYERKEKELAQKEESLKKSQKELEPDKIKKITEQQHVEKVEKKAAFPSVNLLFILIPTGIMMCFMIVFWIRLNSFLAEIKLLVSNDNQIESQIFENESIEESESTNEQENGHNNNLENEKSVDKNTDDKEAEVASENVENIDTSDESITSTENADLSFEYTGYNVKYGDVYIYVKITNTGTTPIFLTSQRFHYLNDISIEKSYSQMDTEILPGKSSLLEIRFDIDTIMAAGISVIDSFTYQYNIAEDADSENLTAGEVTFTELGIT